MTKQLVQMGLFEEVPEPGVPREVIVHRAGTKLDHRWTTRIMGTGRTRTRVHGLYDQSQRVYQSGGELKNFVYWKKQWVSFAKDAWDQVNKKTDWFEVIDHERNECWRIAGQRARANQCPYKDGIGWRVGIPLAMWDVFNADGSIKSKGTS